ncbi:MAG TPA: tetratricopeptide repeat protein, partial [Polyangiaceae bacterium]|nr:tetratricopeptide repeat protein [Polyangiaceae bacterium]
LGNAAEAVDYFKHAADLEPNAIEPLQRLYTAQRALDDNTGALRTLAALADRETSGEAQAARRLAATEILFEQGDSEGAVLQCKLALDADPLCKAARDKLLDIYEQRGDFGAIATLLEQQVDTGAGAHERAAVLGKLASVTWTHLRDDARAFAAATQAIDLDATNRAARLVLAELCYDDERFAEAVAHYDHVVAQLEALSEIDALRTLSNYLDALTQGGNSSKASEVARRILQWPACDLSLLQRAAGVLFDWGAPDEAAQAYRMVLARGADALMLEEQVKALCRLGISSHKRGHTEEARASFESALELDPNSLAALEGLAQVHQDAGAWDKAVEILYRQIDLKTGEEQSDLLLKIGDIATANLKDTDYAARAYLLAFEGLPDSAPQRRTALAKLMQLYSAERDWGRLLQVIQRLADYVDDKSQKAKYLFTGAKVALQQVGDTQQAAQMFDRVLELDPHHAESLKANLEIRRQLGDANALKELLKKEVNAASAKQDEGRALRALDELAQVYARDLGQMEKAIGALQAACDLDPNNWQRREALARCYLDQRAKFPNEALAAYQELLEQQPLSAAVHRGLRHLYTDARNADGAFCTCQTLTALGQATSEERTFFERRRENEMFAAASAISPAEALEIFLHPGADKDFTRLAGLLQPSIERVRGQTLEQLGYRPEHLLQKDAGYPLSSSAAYISQIVGLPPPAILQNPQFEGNLSVLPSTPLCFALGAAGLTHEYPMQAAAFVAGHEMAFGLPGLGIVQLVANHTTLKTWLLGALRIVSPQLGSGSIMPEPLNEASEALHRDLVGSRRDVLVGLATKMTQGAPVDLKKWLAGVELTADRVGFFFCNDLTIALEMIQGNHTGSQWVTVERRSEELLRYAASTAYLAARARLGAARAHSSPPMAASAYGAAG